MVPKILQKYQDEDKTREVLKEFGKRLGAQLLRFWVPKKKDIKGILKETYRFFLKRKLKKFIEKDNEWVMVDSDCIMCWEGIEEFGNIHYCTPMSGVLEEFINTLRKKSKFSHLPKIKCETIESKAHGDDMCRHKLTVVD